MAQDYGVPLFKVQRPMRSTQADAPWLFYTERMRAQGESIEIPTSKVPDRIKREMGVAFKCYLYLNITDESVPDEDGPPEWKITYVARESSNKKTNW